MTTASGRRPRRWIPILCAVLGAVVLIRVGVGLWGRSRLRAFLAETEPAWNAERERLDALRHPWDAAASSSCARAYLAAAERLEGDTAVVGVAVLAPPRAKVAEEARAAVDRNRAAIEAFSNASRCGRYSAEAGEAWTHYERAIPLFNVARLAVIDARLRAEQGDRSGALDRLLAVLKAGSDLREGTFLANAVGASMIGAASETLGALVADGALSAEERERAERSIAALTPRLPGFSHAIGRERLFLRWAAREVDADSAAALSTSLDGSAPSSWRAWLLPVNAMFAAGLREQDAFYRDSEAVAARERDAAAQRSAIEKVEPAGKSGPVAGVAMSASAMATQGRSLCLPLAWQRLVGAAIAIERGGASPEALAAPIEDPCSAGALSYSRSADGRYVLSSAGKDGVASNDDLRVERTVPRP